MNGYLAFFNGKQVEIYAPTLYDAKQQALQKFKVPKSKAGLLAVVLCEKDGEPVTHSTGSL